MIGDAVKLISGPGCPVCVTEPSYIDQAIHLAGHKDVVLATYGDMIRVPGSEASLADARAQGAEVVVVYSAEKAVDLAARRTDKHVVFLGIGFETTAPGTALAIQKAKALGLENFSVFCTHKLIPPVMEAMLAAEDVAVQAFLCPGHVSVIIGWGAYETIAQRHSRPCVVAGFDPPQIARGIAEILRQLVEGRPEACSVYPAVGRDGNPAARRLLEATFTPCDARWRGVGEVPGSGLALRKELGEFDTARRFDLPAFDSAEPDGCRCGDVICGRCEPAECGWFATRCTPRHPIGPCMVSSEGACAAAYKYGRRERSGEAPVLQRETDRN